ncbi:hypothetical protein HK104_006938 [Borealophlyctis nickersoniae]|nr:hypothetical protein HK104_006938 [Borealophlyctis nickersoniae]
MGWTIINHPESEVTVHTETTATTTTPSGSVAETAKHEPVLDTVSHAAASVKSVFVGTSKGAELEEWDLLEELQPPDNKHPTPIHTERWQLPLLHRDYAPCPLPLLHRDHPGTKYYARLRASQRDLHHIDKDLRECDGTMPWSNEATKVQKEYKDERRMQTGCRRSDMTTPSSSPNTATVSGTLHAEAEPTLAAIALDVCARCEQAGHDEDACSFGYPDPWEDHWDHDSNPSWYDGRSD